MDNINTNKTAKLYASMIIAGLLITALALTLVLTGIGSGKNASINTEETSNTAIIFATPVLNAEVAKGFSDSELQYSATLKQWEAHKAIDFATTAKEDVFCVLDGTVESVSSPYLTGTTIVINHGNNLKTVYASLDEDVNVKEGDSVKKGTAIGKTSTSAQAETAEGNHLHFEVLLKDKKVDPSAYLTLENK